MRYPSIEILRASAIFMMILVHFSENLSGTNGFGWVPSGVAAPLFTFLSGMSYRLWLNAQEARGVADLVISKRTIRRGLFLFATGFAFNILVWLPEDTFNWDILTFIGAALLSLNVARRLPASILLLICVTVFLVSPFLRDSSDYAAAWENGYFKCDLTLSAVSLGFLANGYFPFLPWIIFPLAGFVSAAWVFPETPDSKPSSGPLALFGVALLVASGLAFLLRSYASATVQKHLLSGWTMFPPSMPYVAGTLGYALLTFVLAHRWIDGNPRFAKEGRVAIFAKTFSTHSLSIYVLHHVIHLWPLWLYGEATGHDATHYWRTAMPDSASLPLSILFVVCCYVLFRWMDRTGRGGIESLMRWICD